MSDILLTYANSEIFPIEKMELDVFMQELIDTEFDGKECLLSKSTLDLIESFGFSWDPLSIPGYLTFRPYAAFMEEATKLHIWKIVQHFCANNHFPVQRIAGGDLYSLDRSLMKNHVRLAEKVGMYGDGLLSVTGNQILRFSGCSNKLSLLKQVNFDDKELPVGIFEISDSYRDESEDRLDYLVRNRLFHLPELHIINENLENGLEMLLKGHSQMVKDMMDHDLDFIMLFSTTRQFLLRHKKFIDDICRNCSHPPIINAFEDESCENGIVFDVEYKARMANGTLVEIGTFQIDEGTTGFAYDITYKGKPVTTVHAVFFASSIERTIYTYCDKVANSDALLPAWLTPIQCRIIPMNDNYLNMAIKKGNKLSENLRTEVDDRNNTFDYKLKEALKLKVPYIIRVGQNTECYNQNKRIFEKIDCTRLLSMEMEASCVFNQYSPIRLSQKII